MDALSASLSRLRDVLSDGLAAEVRTLGERYGIRNIRVFGSFARGDARPDSDLDLLVEYVPGSNGFAFVSSANEWKTSSAAVWTS